MDKLLQLRAWTYQRQGLKDKAATLEAALAQTLGVYSSHPTAPLNLWARTQNFSAEAFRALESEKAVVRVPALRGSIFLLLNEDAALFTPFRAPLKLDASLLRSMGITADEFPALKEKVVAATKTPLTPAEIRAATNIESPSVATIARLAAREGEIVRVGSSSLRANSLRYVSTATWYPPLLDPMPADDAWKELATRYLTAYGPARVEDFRWWIGCTKIQAERAIKMVETTDIGDGLLLLSKDVEAFNEVKPLSDEDIAILPKWDTYTMGLAGDGRARFLDPKMQPRAYNSVGDGLSLVLVAGEAVGAWHHSFKGAIMQVELDCFTELKPAMLERIYAIFDEIARVLEGKSAKVTLATEPLAPRLSFIRGAQKATDD